MIEAQSRRAERRADRRRGHEVEADVGRNPQGRLRVLSITAFNSARD